MLDPETHKATGESAFVWCSCEVLRISDGTVAKLGRNGEPLKSKHPAGHVLVRWEENTAIGDDGKGEGWIGLLPSKWNTDQAFAWRCDPDFGVWS